MLAGAFGEDELEAVDAVRVEGAAFPMSDDPGEVGANVCVAVVTGVDCPNNEEDSGAANAIGMTDLLGLVSFNGVDASSCSVVDEGDDELVVGVTGVNSAEGDSIVAVVGRRINR